MENENHNENNEEDHAGENPEKKGDHHSSSEESSENEDDYLEKIKKPLRPKLYVSPTNDDTVKEILQENILQRDFGKHVKFNELDPSEKYKEIRFETEPLFTKKRVLEIGLQGCHPAKESSAQTNFNRKINRMLEPFPITSTDVSENNEKEKEKEEDNTEMIQFLSRVYPLMEEALQDNETDIASEVSELSNNIKEIKSFFDLTCKGKKISCIQFFPAGSCIGKGKYIIAESFIENLSFDDRALLSTKSYSSNIIFWDFEDIHSIEPILILKSPLEILCFEFNPKDPNYVAGGDHYQVATISEDGQILFWDTRLSEKEQKKQQDSQIMIWKAHYGIQLFRPEGGGPMGGGFIAFQKGQKNASFAGTSDEGEVFMGDWTVRPSEESSKADIVTRLWQQERSYRPCVGLDRSKDFDDIILSLHDFHFVVWKSDVDVPIFSSQLIKGAHITCGGFSPYRPGVVIIGKFFLELIGRTDGWLDIWDFMDQSHKCTMRHNVCNSGISCIKFHETMHHIISVGDIDGTLHILEMPYTLCKKHIKEEETMKDFWARETKRVAYFQERFALRDEKYKEEKKEKEKMMEEQEDIKVEDKENEEVLIENEYKEFLKKYLEEEEGGGEKKEKEKKEKK